MRIRELHIGRFGGLADRHFAPEPGLSLVFGSNEAGKSTILAFIHAMLYGLTGRARGISENERKRRLPWGEDRMGGWLVFEHAGRVYRIERTFGAVRRQDQRTLRDETTGEAIPLPGAREIGDWLFGVSEAEFDNTVCIRQLATADVQADDETLAKLANLATTGDERISADTVDARLRKAMTAARAEKGSGGLIPALTARRQELAQEWQNVLSRESERSARIRAYQSAAQARDALARLLADGKCLQTACSDLYAVEAASEAAGRLAELQELERQTAELHGSLQLDGHPAGWTDLAELRARHSRLTTGQARQAEMQAQQDAQLARLARLQDSLSAYAALSGSDTAASLECLETVDRLEAELISLRQRLVTLGELQITQSRLTGQSDEARRRCEEAQRALDEWQDVADAERQAAEEEVEQRRLAVSVLPDHMEPARGQTGTAGPGTGRRHVSLLIPACGLLLLVTGLAAGLRITPVALVLMPAGAVLFGLYAWLSLHRTGGSRTGPSMDTQDAALRTQPVRADAELAIRQAWEDSRTRLAALQLRHSQRDQQLTARLADCHTAWETAEAFKNSQAADWQAILSGQLAPARTSAAVVCLPDEPASGRPNDAAAPDADRISSETSQAIATLLSAQASLQERLAQAQAAAQIVLGDAGCDTAAAFRERLAECQDLERQAARLAGENEQRAGAIDALAAANAGLANGLRQQLLQLTVPAAGEPAAVQSLDMLLEQVQQSLTRLDRLQTALAEKRRDLGQTDNGDMAARQQRLQQQFPGGAAELSDALDVWLKSVREWLATATEAGMEPESISDAAVNATSDVLKDAMTDVMSDAMMDVMSDTAADAAALAAAAAFLAPSGPVVDQTGGRRPDMTRSGNSASSPDSTGNPTAGSPGTRLAMDKARLLPAGIDALQACLQRESGRAIRLDSDLRHRFSQLRNLEDVDLDLAAVDRRLQAVQEEYAALKLAREVLDAAFRELQQSFGPQLNRRGGEILARLTDGRHVDMRVDRSLQILVPDPATGLLHEFDYLSGGTIDQAYLALRLAVAELVCGPNGRLPLLLDDALLQYDDQRAGAALAFLREYAEEQDLQILLFTCHGRLLDQPVAVIQV